MTRQTDSAKKITVGIVGLGLIGGSMARAYHEKGHTVLASDKDAATLEAALSDGVAAAVLDKESVATCDLLLLAVYPKAAIATLEALAPHIKKETVVLDLCGTKREVCKACFAIAAGFGFAFVGGHPMAGTQFSGYQKSRANLFCGAPMVLVLPENAPDLLEKRVKALLSPVSFSSFAVCNADTHDRVIAFTSQLAHIVSNAYVKSPQAQVHHGFSAGSYKDLTRVAWLNEKMWCELFLENSDYLAEEIDTLITSLTAYRQALTTKDADTLTALLREGRLAKEMADKEDKNE